MNVELREQKELVRSLRGTSIRKMSNLEDELDESERRRAVLERGFERRASEFAERATEIAELQKERCSAQQKEQTLVHFKVIKVVRQRSLSRANTHRKREKHS